MPRILIPDSVTWELPELPLEVIRFKRSDSLEGLDAEGLVVWGITSKGLAPLLEMPSLRWVQTFTAGINHVLDLNPSEGILVSNGKGLHDAPTAELAVTLLLSAVRRMHLHRDHQAAKSWDKAFYNQAVNAPSTQLMTLEGANVLILGMGAIGLEIAHRLQPFGASVEGVANTSGDREGFVTHAIEDLDLVLPSADAVIMVLPDTPATQHIMNAERLALLSPRAWVVNVGRGSAIDENALIAALEKHEIGGAALDVTDIEPLPSDSKLWTLENCILTPHIAGGGPNLIGKANALLERNAEKFVAGETLENLVSRKKGY
jgi:phosphoglycerate dehydrogenase-like enzyme